MHFVELSIELKVLVRESVSILGDIIANDLGARGFDRIENLRAKMVRLRGLALNQQIKVLEAEYNKLSKVGEGTRYDIARAFTLMLELMNACENAYRSHRLAQKAHQEYKKGLPEKIVYVLTAHPTEARAPQNIFIFHKIQQILARSLVNFKDETNFEFLPGDLQALRNALEIAWRAPIVRDRAPEVKDEADHIYSMLFRDDVILSLLGENDVPFLVRSWVGGDKDGHPGVNEKTLLQSLSLSRAHIAGLIEKEFCAAADSLEGAGLNSLLFRIKFLRKKLSKLVYVRPGDLKLVESFKSQTIEFVKSYTQRLKNLDPHLKNILKLLEIFPGLVVPLELRESSDVLMSQDAKMKNLAIFKMLLALKKLAGRQNPSVYARGFIISMTGSIEHIRAAADFEKKALGKIYLPIIPLFEQTESLSNSQQIVTNMLNDQEISTAAKKFWQSQIEMMVGYSDSAKEAGVLLSRLKISEALPALEKICLKKKFKPVFFHGSGGSIDRGGGSIEDQTAWWPRTALLDYKVTVQGEMVERSLANSLIAKRQVETIVESVSKRLASPVQFKKDKILDIFAEKVSQKYRSSITQKDFLNLVELATPYSYLNFLKIGSRPTKRSKKLTVQGLRAIPWVLCWTQTRVLFQTWWGVGSAWHQSSLGEREHLKKSFRKQPVFNSYIRALGFTLAKVELGVWRIYLEQSRLSAVEARLAFDLFASELKLTKKFYRDICGTEDLMWSKPWLGESISLRSPMIHPLNLIQILAQKSKNAHLLRLTVTGISSGMMTTG